MSVFYSDATTQPIMNDIASYSPQTTSNSIPTLSTPAGRSDSSRHSRSPVTTTPLPLNPLLALTIPPLPHPFLTLILPPLPDAFRLVVYNTTDLRTYATIPFCPAFPVHTILFVFRFRHLRRTAQTCQYNFIVSSQVVHDLQVRTGEPFRHVEPAEGEEEDD